jgi:uncharacterized membrane protein
MLSRFQSQHMVGSTMDHPTERESWTSFVLPVALILGLVILLSVNIAPTEGEHLADNPLEPWLALGVGYLAAAAEIAAAVVIGAAIVRNGVGYIRVLFLPWGRASDMIEGIRLRLGRSLVLGLEFTVASDILRTVVAPTREDILTLAAIVLLRTLLNYFLEREIRHVEERQRARHPAQEPVPVEP